MKLLSILSLWLASCILSLGAGALNGVAVTHWNGIAFTAWNGSGVSAAGGGGGGGPTLVASDNFDAYANGDPLDNAANWVQEGAGSITTTKPGSDGTVTGASVASLCRHTATINADQRAEMTIDATISGGGYNWIGPAVRIQSGAVTGYAVVISSTDIFLISFNAGTVATVNSDGAATLAAGNKIAIECSGAGASARLKVQIDTGSGWVDKWTNQDPAVDIDGGSAGVGSWLFNASGNLMDDFASYNL